METCSECGLMSLAKRMVSLMVSRGLPRQADDERTVNGDPEITTVLGELAGPLDLDPLFDVSEDLLVPGLVAHQEQAEAVVAQDLERFVGHVGLGVAGPAPAPAGPCRGRSPLPARRPSVKVSSSKKTSFTAGQIGDHAPSRPARGPRSGSDSGARRPSGAKGRTCIATGSPARYRARDRGA